MKIIVEGPDNSGKSTLIRHLSGSLGIPIVPGEGPGRSSQEINERVRRYATISNAIFDRHPCVSQTIYNKFRRGPEIDAQLIAEFYQQDTLFVYCVGRPTLEGQVIKDYDTSHTDELGVVHEQTVAQHHLDICAAYETWASEHAHVVYRIGDGFSKVTAIVAAIASYRHFDPVADIADFHMKFGLTYNGPPRVLPRDVADFRLRFMQEELDEYAAHEAGASTERLIHNKPDEANYAFHLENMLDALVDEVYVVLGTSYLHGFNFREAWRRVHEANMRKVRAKRAEDSKRGSVYDVVKPPEWVPPSHVDLVEVNDITSGRVSV